LKSVPTIPAVVVAVGVSFAFDSALEMPKPCVSLRRRQMLERTKVPQQRSREYGRDCRDFRHTIARWRRLWHFVEAFCLFLTSDQTCPRIGRSSLRCSDGWA